jgi:glutamate dehydrogenase (NAD(P)+)
MTLKNALAGLPHGGGKSVIFGDPRAPVEHRQTWVRAFACAIRDLVDYIPGPDMGTNEQSMAWVRDEIGRAVGLPPEIGGIPLDVIGATGFGLAVAAEVAQEFCDLDLQGARVAVQGFGSVGRHASRFLAERGAVLVAAADSTGTVVDPDGLDLAALTQLKSEGRGLADAAHGEHLHRDAVIGVDCDIWIPAARPDVVHAGNVEQLKARLVLQGANIPCTLEAEQALHERGVLVLPDFLANAGGVICAAMEYRGSTESAVFASIEERIRNNTREVLEASKSRGILPRQAAENLSVARIQNAMGNRRWSIF